MDQVIRSDGRIIRLATFNKFADTKGCPEIKIKSDDHGFYVHSHWNEMDGFYAVDVTSLWNAPRTQPSE